jgi:hypothetical protein
MILGRVDSNLIRIGYNYHMSGLTRMMYLTSAAFAAAYFTLMA